VVNTPTGEAQTRQDVVRFQVGKLTEHILGREPVRQQVKDVSHADARPSDARSPAALFGINGDALCKAGQ